VCLIVSCGPETCGGIGCQPFADASQYEQVTHICSSLVTGKVWKFLVCGKLSLCDVGQSQGSKRVAVLEGGCPKFSNEGCLFCIFTAFPCSVW